jgi:hypothetical protein
MKSPVFIELMKFLTQLEQSGLSYTLGHYREDALLVSVAVPGERWEVEFLADGSVEVEQFVSRGEIAGQEALTELVTRYGEPEQNEAEAVPAIELVLAK